MLRFGIVESNSVACGEDLASSSSNFGTYDRSRPACGNALFWASLRLPTLETKHYETRRENKDLRHDG